MDRQQRHYRKVSKRGQVTIPALLLREFGLGPGEIVEFRFEDGAVRIRKADPVRNAYGILHRPGMPRLTDKELKEAVREASSEAATARYLRSTRPPSE